MIAAYQKHEQVVERVGGAAGLALLVYLSGLLELYPPEWRLVVPIGIFLVGSFALPAAYILSVIAIAYPLASLSIYLAALFLALAIIPMAYALNNIWAVLFICAAPFLNTFGLAFVAPLAAGLLMSRREGLLVGGGSYLSLWMIGAYTYPPDTAHLHGPIDALQGRFGGAGSFETIGKILNPLAPNSSALLNNILHLAIWAAAGYLCAIATDYGAQRAEQVASLNLGNDERDWRYALGQLGWHALFPLAAGGAILVLGLSLMPALLNQPLANLRADLLNYGTSVLLGGLVALTLWLLLWYLRQPLPIAPQRMATMTAAPRPAPTLPPVSKPTTSTIAATMPATPSPPPAPLPRPEASERVIMIEID